MSAFESNTACRMSAYEVLILMFNSVLKAMYREDWKTLAEESASLACPPTTSSPWPPPFNDLPDAMALAAPSD
ncbi:MAG: hypothetical protein MZV70_28975 [Desulfobacterales bacterium]|nr:hypothetical protein [Desulfobacterales bacterium]